MRPLHMYQARLHIFGRGGMSVRCPGVKDLTMHTAQSISFSGGLWSVCIVYNATNYLSFSLNMNILFPMRLFAYAPSKTTGPGLQCDALDYRILQHGALEMIEPQRDAL